MWDAPGPRNLTSTRLETLRPRSDCAILIIAARLENTPGLILGFLELDFARVLEIVTTFFRTEAYPFAVIGALGLHAYGMTRATSDLDFVTAIQARPKLVSFMESLGYETLHVSKGF